MDLQNNFLLLRRWFEGFNMENFVLDEVELWVQFWGCQCNIIKRNLYGRKDGAKIVEVSDAGVFQMLGNRGTSMIFRDI
ncbi:hypothetical protein L6164_012108 [Bauhinia variegata]|uniref:Uncharacterized protein n=1 Tax=Bauhinia variegata TaxID=167791 RepID=A0ACB9P987_BAUVA|nr:hypothetical protein L6164_012108 [Bauhinia variegata]